MGKRHYRFPCRLGPSVIALAVIACLMLVGLSHMLDAPSRTEEPSPRQPASYLAK